MQYDTISPSCQRIVPPFIKGESLYGSGDPVLSFQVNVSNVVSGYIAKLQIKPKSKSNQTKNLERLYNWVVVVVVVVHGVRDKNKHV